MMSPRIPNKITTLLKFFNHLPESEYKCDRSYSFPQKTVLVDIREMIKTQFHLSNF